MKRVFVVLPVEIEVLELFLLLDFELDLRVWGFGVDKKTHPAGSFFDQRHLLFPIVGIDFI